MNIRQFARRTGLVIAMAMLAALASAAPNVSPSIFFVENAGQWDGAFRFRASLGSQDVFLTETGMTLNLMRRERPAHSARNLPWDTDPGGEWERPARPRRVQGHVLRLNFQGANPCPALVGQAKLASYSNYFLGRDSSRWKSRVGHYQRVLSQEVWPGIDVEYVLTPAGVELVYHLQAGADPAQIQIQIEGLQAPLALDAAGNLILPTSLGLLVEQAPSAFQNGRAIPCRYRLSSDSTYTFTLDQYDPHQILTIDPLLYSSYFGSPDPFDELNVLVFDTISHTLLLGGVTHSDDFPTTPGAYQDSLHGPFDLYVSRFSADGHSLLFSTLLGGSSGTDRIHHLLPRHADIIGTTWITESPDWPLTSSAFDTTFAGNSEGAFWRLSTDGTELLYSSYWGGLGADYVEAFQGDSAGRIYLAGRTSSPDFSITSTALYPMFQGAAPAYVSVFDTSGSSLLYSTFFPGDYNVYANDLDVVAPFRVWLSGNAYSGIPLTVNALQSTVSQTIPTTPFLALLDLAQDTLLYSSYFGGTDHVILGSLLPLDSQRVMLTGQARSAPDFPVTADAYDTVHADGKTFLTELALPATIVHSTLFGSLTNSGETNGRGLVLDPAGGPWVGGITWAIDYPCTEDAVDLVYTDPPGQEFGDGFVARFSPTLDSLRFSSYLGGSGKDIVYAVAQETSRRIWIGGNTESVDFLVTPDAYQTLSTGWGDGFFSLLQLPADSVPPDTENTTDPFILHPSTFRLSAYPNPFNSTTQIRYTVPQSGRVSLTLYDLLGREVRVLTDDVMTAGDHRAALDAGDLASGIYFIRLSGAGEREITRKLLLVR